MIYFHNLRRVDRVTFEGREVKQTIPVTDRETKRVTHYHMVVADGVGNTTLRKFRAEEVDHLIERELLVIDRDYYSLARQTDRSVYGGDGNRVVCKTERARVERVAFLARRMDHYYRLGMRLTPDGVREFVPVLEEEYRTYQSQLEYGTLKSNSTQSLKPLPSVTTLLEYYRKFRRAGCDHRVFLRPKKRPTHFNHQEAEDLRFVLSHLYGFAVSTRVAKSDVGEKTLEAVVAENQRRAEAGYPKIKVRSAYTYQRWINKYLDPFVVMAQRDGLAAAMKKFGSVDKIPLNLLPGEQVQFDAWQVHIVILDTTRERWLRMTEEERRKVPRVRRWIVLGIDVATRKILGYALCRNPNQAASLEALRMCFMDKTPMFQRIGLTNADGSQRAPIQLVVTDSGSEFGKHPFGGAEFGEAVRLLTGSLMNTTAGVPELRGVVERLFLTFDLKWARKIPGWTSHNPQKLNDRKPHLEACLTDDDLRRQVIAFIAEYNTSSHRGIGGFTPNGMWAKLVQDPAYDPTMMPGPKHLREACGVFREATISEDGIRFENIKYSNEFIRTQRLLPVAERIDRGTGKVEIKVDLLDLGAISVRTGEDMISVPALDSRMIGMPLSDWRSQRVLERAEARADVEAHSDERNEARNMWEGEAAAITKSANINIKGMTLTEINRAALEITMGKGHHEKPFIGRDEYQDALMSGFTLSGEEDGPPPPAAPDTSTDIEPDPNTVAPDAPNTLDRYRASVKPRSRGQSWKDDTK